MTRDILNRSQPAAMKKCLFIISVIAFTIAASGQADQASLQLRLYNLNADGQAEKLKRFYQGASYEPVWMTRSGQNNRQLIRQILEQARQKGYQGQLLKPVQDMPDSVSLPKLSSKDSLSAELAFTETLLDYLRFLSGMSGRPVFGYEGLDTDRRYNIDSLAGVYLKLDKLNILVDSLRPRFKEIDVLENKLMLLLKRNELFPENEARIVNTSVTIKNTALAKKMFLLGIIDTLPVVSDQAMKQFVKKAQTEFNLLNDGILRSTILEELNIPVAERIRRLSTALSYYRWLYTVSRPEAVIVVNIPAAMLSVYRDDSICLQMRMIVGKPATPTPTLTSRASEVIFYPYWNVPYNIAVNEMLPSIKKNIHYIDANNLQILDKNGRIMQANKINWNALNAANFPYRMRQSTGCDNALGIVKINFYNPFSVYLHDTPVKSLFMLNKRYFSHGCMRMERPMEMIALLLNNRFPPSLDTTMCLEDQQPITLSTAIQMPVVVWYNPVGIGIHENVVFYEDVYRRFRK